MFKRTVALIITLILLALAAGSASAAGEFVTITSPTDGTVISNLGAVLNVTVNFGNAPGGAGLLVRAFDDSESQLFASNATTDVTTVPWNTTLDFTLTPPADRDARASDRLHARFGWAA